jgi:uncharacterized protein
MDNEPGSALLRRKTYNFSGSCGVRWPARSLPIVKFEPDHAEGINTITRHERSAIWVGPTRYGHSVLVPWRGSVHGWAPRHTGELLAEHFETALTLTPELVIFGSGQRLRFVSAALLRCLIERRIGVETMDTPAACRTFNVLASEGRAVVAALLLDAGPGTGG